MCTFRKREREVWNGSEQLTVHFIFKLQIISCRHFWWLVAAYSASLRPVAQIVDSGWEGSVVMSRAFFFMFDAPVASL